MSNTPRFTKLDSAGNAIIDAETPCVAVQDAHTYLTWSVAETERMSWKKALTFAKKLTLCGHDDWRVPTRGELLTLVDDTRYNPAIDTDAFPGCKSEWYWTSTPAAVSPGALAWIVYFNSGGSGWGSQGFGNYVRAVRSSQS